MTRMRWSSGRHAVKFLLLIYSSLLSLTVPAISLTGLSREEYNKLLVYCKPSTGYFECYNATNNSVYCLPESLKCRMHCSNDAQLGCHRNFAGAAAANSSDGSHRGSSKPACPQPTDFPCPAGAIASQRRCIADHLVCDGRPHCADGADESLELCKQRVCAVGQFACAKSDGRCLPLSMRCDGTFDCERTGLADYSDELNCPAPNAGTHGACGPAEFRCLDGKACVDRSFVCDTFNDCADGSDESPDNCKSAAAECEFYCDGRCLKSSVRCDGVIDCSSGKDEAGCPGRGQCGFSYEFACRYSTGKGPRDPPCVPLNFVCDGISECLHGEDEVCPIDRVPCASDSYWTCKSGQHCIPAVHRCDGLLHCPDGSDERSCPTVSTAPLGSPQPTSSLHRAGGSGSSADCPSGYHRVADACVDIDECVEEFGTCDHLCRNTEGGVTCSCLSGYLPIGKAGRRCSAVGAAKLLYSTETGIRLLDSDTLTVAKLPNSPSPELKLVKFLDFDAGRRLVFFHTRDGLVGSLQLGSAAPPTILMRHAVLDAIAYDWTRGLLFYSVPEAGTGGSGSGGIGVLNVDTGRHTWLARLTCPRGLAADPAAGLLYISLWCGAKPGLYTMRMDGSELRPLIVGGRGAPGHVALDIEQGRIYWLDMELKGVYSARLNGSDPRAIWHMGSGYDGIPLGLSQFEDRLIWSDLRAGAVYSIDKFAGQPLKQVLPPQPDSGPVLSAVVYHSVKQAVGGESGSRRCSCDGHICIQAGHDESVCLCDQLSVMKDGVCVPNGDKPSSGGGVPAQQLNRQPVAAESTLAQDDSESGAGQRESLVAAAVAVSGLLLCLAAGAVLAAVCLRRHRRMWNGGVECTGLPKINSRSKLFAHEVIPDVDDVEDPGLEENRC